jgi:hypothetical protein
MLASYFRRKTLVLCVGVVVGMIALSGCAGPQAGVPSASPMSTEAPATATVAATTVPTPTPEPSITVDRDRPSSWIIDFASVGPLVVGGDIVTAKETMTSFTSVVYEGCASVTSYDKPDFPSIVIPDRLGTGILEQIVLQSGSAAAVSANSPRTEQGIGIGSTLAQLQSAYPTLTYQDDNPNTVHYAVSDDGSNWINFSIMDGVVQTIVVRASPVIAKEYCS